MSKARHLPVVIGPADEGKFGPAMRALPTERMRRFVIAVVEGGTANFTQAALAAGYSDGGTSNTIRVTAHRLAHDERVIRAIHEEADRRLRSAAVVAASTLVTLAQDTTDKKVQLRASEAILNRSGLHALTEHKVTVEDVTGATQIERIKEMAKALGLDAKALLGRYGVSEEKKAAAIDVDAEEVSTGREGLEDVL